MADAWNYALVTGLWSHILCIYS